MVTIYLWGRFKDPLTRHLSRMKDVPRGHLPADQDPLLSGTAGFEETVRIITPGTQSRTEPLFSGMDQAVNDHDTEGELDDPLLESEIPPPEDELRGAPFLIQVSVVAGSGRRFHGPDLKQALLDNDLLYGDMGIFHRYNPDLSQTLFSVASLVEPGSFPIDDMDGFECPGIVLFFQTARVQDPVSTYDDLVNTSRELAQQLHGIQWDEHREPLTASKISQMRTLLKHPPQD
jgi:cell division protein ZipA